MERKLQVFMDKSVPIKVKNYGIAKAFYDRYDVNELLKQNGITVEQITNDIEKLLNE